MSSKKPKTSRKDPLKTPKVWERARREKMKIYFNELQEVLPYYDPSTPMSRFEILQKSKTCIKDLQDQNQDLLNGGFDEVYRNKMTKLKQRVKELLKRVDQLTDLLRAANIVIPPIEMYHQSDSGKAGLKWMNQRPRKWTEKIDLVVPDDKIKSVLSLIKDYKKSTEKMHQKQKLNEKADKNNMGKKEGENNGKNEVGGLKKKRKTAEVKKDEKDQGDNESFSGSQSPSQFKENQPVDYNLLSNSNNGNKITVNRTSNSESKQSSESDGGDCNSSSTGQNTSVPLIQKSQSNPQILTLQTPANKIGISQTLVDVPQSSLMLPSPAPSVLQSNTFLLTNDGNLVQLPIINPSNAVFDGNSNLLPAATIIKPNTGLLTPIVINKPSPQVIVLQQKPTAPIIQTAQILNATPQVISVSKPNVQIINSSIIYTSPNAITTTRPLAHIMSKAPANKKRIMRDSTITTYVNKIPIAALSKHSYTKKTNMSTATENEKTKSVIVDGKSKEVAITVSTSTSATVLANNKTSEMEATDAVNTQHNESPVQETEQSVENETSKSKQVDAEKGTFEGETVQEEFSLGTPVKRSLGEEKPETSKKSKIKGNLEENFFKPIENPIETDPMFCNLTLPSSINPSLSVSPTAAFLSNFPIVTPVRSETDDDVSEKKTDDSKSAKADEEPVQPHQQQSKMSAAEKPPYGQADNNFYSSEQPSKLATDCSVRFPENDRQTNKHGSYQKNNFFVKDHQCKAMDKRPEAKCYAKPAQNVYQQTNSNNLFDYTNVHPQPNKMSLSKTGSVYPQTNNFFMGNQTSKIAEDCPNQFAENDQNKINYQKNEFYGKPDLQQQQQPHCKNSEKRSDSKCYPKVPQNTGYNIFDYNYSGSCYGEDDASKYLQPYPVSNSNGCGSNSSNTKNKKSISGGTKKKLDGLPSTGNEDPSKRAPEQIISNLDLYPAANQECFSWMPGKNVDWFPGKSFGLDSNLVVPSTLPTLMGDLALGTTSTTSTNDNSLIKPSAGNIKSCGGQSNLKALTNDITKEYDLGISNGLGQMSKIDGSMEQNKQYLEPFANLSKNIFDMTPSNFHNAQMGKNDFLGIPSTNNGNNNETIILKNIFELPVSKSSDLSPDFNRHKQRNINSTQNTFLSVSQLVEPPTFDGNMKTDGQLETSATKNSSGNLYNQTYPNYNNQKSFGKSKSRSSHCKYGSNGDRKYQGYKNVGGGSSSYTAEALIRSNNASSVLCHPNVEFPGVDLNPNYFNPKTSQTKPEQFLLGNDLNTKSDFQTPNQTIYTDFNFSSPVPNFGIPPAAPTADFGSHEINSNGNFTSQNNTYFGDFIPPEYPLTDNVSNSLLIPPCSISLKNPFVIDKRSFPVDKGKSNSKQNSGTKNRKHYECSKTGFNDFSSGPAGLSCPTIFTSSACPNLLPVPTQSISISFPSPSFTNGNISFPPPLVNASSAVDSYNKYPGGSVQNPITADFAANATFSPSKADSSGGVPVSMPSAVSSTSTSASAVQNCYSTNPLANSVISSPFTVGNVPSFSTSSQSTIPFFSLSNPIVPSSLPTSSSNSLANFNLSTIFPEINQKGNYHYS